jgi:hypothetical protein
MTRTTARRARNAGEDAPNVSARETASAAFASVEVLREREAGAPGRVPECEMGCRAGLVAVLYMSTKGHSSRARNDESARSGAVRDVPASVLVPARHGVFLRARASGGSLAALFALTLEERGVRHAFFVVVVVRLSLSRPREESRVVPVHVLHDSRGTRDGALVNGNGRARALARARCPPRASVSGASASGRGGASALCRALFSVGGLFFGQAQAKKRPATTSRRTNFAKVPRDVSGATTTPELDR